MRKKDLRMSTISQARRSANQVRQTKVVARARKTSSHPLLRESLHPLPRFPSPKPKTISAKALRQSAPAQIPYTLISRRTSHVKTPIFNYTCQDSGTRGGYV